jgi:serine protease AprX
MATMLSNSIWFRSTSIFFAALILSATAANAQAPQRLMSKLDARLSSSVRARHSDTKRVIIRTNSDGIHRLTDALKGNRRFVRRHHSTINALTAHVPVAELESLSNLSFVESISEDAIVRAEQTFSDASTLRGTLGLPVQTPGGYGVGIAVIDSGLEDGPEFAGRIDGFYDFTQDDVKSTDPTDGYGHGTHVAGLIAGNGVLSDQRYRGVAPKARLIVLKVLDENGAGYTSDVIDAIEFATRNKSQLGIDIINLSLGHPILEPAATDPLVQAVEAAVRAGIVVVAAAGNVGVSPSTGEPGYAGILSPGNAPSAITIGSARTFDTNLRSDDRVANYSSRGPTWYDARVKPDLVAPGHGLVAAAAKSSTLYANHPALRVDDAYLRLNGTSMATAVVSGTAALVLQANPRLTPNAVKAILQFTAFPVRDDQGAQYDVLTQGTGSVNAAGAIELAAHIDSKRAVSSWWLTTSLNPATVIDGEAVAWAESIVWSDAISFGPVVAVNQPAWSNNIVWGSSDDNIVWGSSDDNIVWGSSDDNIVWGSSNDNIVWGSNIVWGNNIVWASDDNIVWGSNIVWGNTLLGSAYGTSITWGMAVDDPSQTVWGTLNGSVGSTGFVLTSPSP